MIDNLAILQQFLRAQTAIVALTGTRIYGPPHPEHGYEAEEDGSALLYHDISGRVLAHAPIETLRIQFDCHAKSLQDARALYGAVYDSIHAQPTQVVGAGEVKSSIQVSGARTFRDEETGEARVTVDYEITFST